MNILPDIEIGLNEPVPERRLLQARQDRWALEMDRAMFATQPGAERSGPESARSRLAATDAADGRGINAANASHTGADGGVSSSRHGFGAAIAQHDSAYEHDGIVHYAALVPDSAFRILAGSAQGALWLQVSDFAGGRLLSAAAGVAADSVPRLGALPAHLSLGTSAMPRVDADSPKAIDPDSPQPFAEHDGAPTASEEYAQRLLHIYRTQDEVRAWIRDARLAEGQIGAVARALASEVAFQGARLSTLTVNGRLIALDSAQGDSAASYRTAHLSQEQSAEREQSKGQ
jgi:hypothetical protein